MNVLLGVIRFKEKLKTINRPMAIEVICGLMIVSSLNIHGQSALDKTEYFIGINGAKIFTKSVGSGTPLLIIHGGPALSHDYLEPQLIECLAADYKLIFFDQRGSGRSSGAEDTTLLTMAQFVDDIESIRKYFNLNKVNVLGHSFGGLIAMYYALAYPDAIGRLIILDSAPASWDPYFPMLNLAVSERATEADKEELAKIRSLGPTMQPATMERYFKIYFRPFFKNSQLTEDISLGVTEQWVLNYFATYPRIMKNLGKHNILDKLSSINALTLVIHGEDSVMPLESSQAISNHIPNSKLTILKNTGHFPYIESPQDFANAVKEFVE